MMVATQMVKWFKMTLLLMALSLSSGCCCSPPAGPLTKTFEAHGGLKKWQNQRTMRYTLNGFPLSKQVALPNTATADLHKRHHYIQGQNFQAGYDGENTWALPDNQALGLPPRFFTLGSFYFIAMPFVFADPGVIVQEQGTTTFRNRSFREYHVGFKSDTGHTSEDEYVLLVDPETNRLALIHHSVTENPDIDRVTWIFDEWKKSSGLLMPARMTFLPGWNPQNHESGNSFVIENLSFSQNSPDPKQFIKP